MHATPAVFALAVHDGATQTLPGTTRRTLDADGAPVGLEVLAEPGQKVVAHHDRGADRAVYLWGIAVHPTITEPAALLQWFSDEVRKERALGLREVVGNYVVMIDDRRAGQITFAADFCAIRPWFVGSHQGRLTAGSSAWGLAENKLTSGAVNYDALATWLKFNYDWTTGLFADHKRLTPGAVMTFDRTGQLLSERDWASMAPDNIKPPTEQVVDELHERVSRATRLLTRGLTEVNVPLSGGFDSRYLLAIASQIPGLKVTAINVRTSDAETELAQKVGKALGVEVQVLPMGGHNLDPFDDPFPFSAAGFPMGMNIASVAVRSHPTTVISGYLGDVVMRGYADHSMEKSESECTDAELAQNMYRQHTFKIHRIDLMRDGLDKRVNDRALAVMQRIAAASPDRSRTFYYSNMRGRQRFYIANIWLQTLGQVETLVPFYTWEMFEYKMTRSPEVFKFENYPALFARHFPMIADLPHNSRIAKKSAPQQPSRHLKRFAKGLIKPALFGGAPSVIPRKKLLKRLPGGLMGKLSQQDEIVFMHKLQMLEQQFAKCGLSLDWSKL